MARKRKQRKIKSPLTGLLKEVISGLKVGLKVAVVALPAWIASFMFQLLATATLGGFGVLTGTIALGLSASSIIAYLIGLIGSGMLWIKYKRWIFA